MQLNVPTNLSPESVAELHEEVMRVKAAEPDGALVLQGGQSVFCSGLELSAVSLPADSGALNTAIVQFAEILIALCRMNRPVISVVSGAAVGGGVGLAAASDYAIATPGSSFCLPECLIGLVPGAVYPVLLRRVDVARLNVMSMDGRTRSAEEAAEIGLVDMIVEETNIPSILRRLSRDLCRGHSGAIEVVKSFHSQTELECAIRHGIGRTAELIATPEAQKRIQAMRDGKAPWLA
ncbi:MAG: enoyl-CoA hydratase/isomerase family protein [Alphaproteobacteria bacterium]|nr:enoyl-CoA hydratase/isomerase family protein [Alphaproteobacteria bacterium]